MEKFDYLLKFDDIFDLFDILSEYCKLDMPMEMGFP